jgi:twitching motility protein PilT
MRLHGDMRPIDALPALSEEQVRALLAEVMPERIREDFERRHDADFSYEVPGVARFRVNMFRDRKGMGAVFRQIPIEIVTAEKLGLPKAIEYDVPTEVVHAGAPYQASFLARIDSSNH